MSIVQLYRCASESRLFSLKPTTEQAHQFQSFTSVRGERSPFCIILGDTQAHHLRRVLTCEHVQPLGIIRPFGLSQSIHHLSVELSGRHESFSNACKRLALCLQTFRSHDLGVVCNRPLSRAETLLHPASVHVFGKRVGHHVLGFHPP